MPFVIRASDKVGDIGWVRPANSRGRRAIGSRADAEVFAERSEAEAVVQRMRASFPVVTLTYTVEAFDQSSSESDA